MIIEKIKPKDEEEIILNLTVSDVEIYRLDYVRYLNLQRKKKCMHVIFQTKEK